MIDYVPGRVSVIVPAYNHAAYVRECIDSALNQTYPDVEVVVVDDGSTDGTYEILQTYGDRIKLIRQENAGTQAARNAAIRASTGEFLALLDSDDMWLPEKLERQTPLFAEQRIGLVYSYAQTIDHLGHPREPLVFGDVLCAASPAFDSLIVRNPVPTVTAVFRRLCVDVLGGFDESFVGIADRDMWLRIATRWAVACKPEPLAWYRVHPLNTTKMLYATRLAYQERLAVLAKAQAHYAPPEVPAHVWDTARAEAEILGAECAAMDDDVEEASRHLKSACQLSPEVLKPPSGDTTRIIGLAMRRQQAYGWDGTANFARRLYDSARGAGIDVRVERTAELAELSLGEAFAHYHSASQRGIAAPLGRAIAACPRYLTNPGVWSLIGTVILGPSAMRVLRPIARRVLCRS